MDFPNTTKFRDSNKRTAREGWLEARRSMLGASDSYVLLGQGYANQSPWSVWEEKLFPSPDNGSLKFRIGLALEHGIAQILAEEQNWQVEPRKGYAVTRHPTDQHIGCSLDGIADIGADTLVPCELKNIGQHAAKEWGWCESCAGSGCDACSFQGRLTPTKYLIQIQHQMLVTGATQGVVAALIGGQSLECRVVDIDLDFVEALRDELRRFWREHIEARKPPPVDASEAAKQALHRLYPVAEPGTCIALPDEYAMAAQLLQTAREQKKIYEEEITACENRLKAFIGDNQYGALPDGRFVKWQRSEIAGKTISYERAAYTQHKLSIVKSLPKGVTYDPSTSRGTTVSSDPAAAIGHGGSGEGSQELA